MKRTKFLFTVLVILTATLITSCMGIDDYENTYTVTGYCTITGTNPSYKLYLDGGGVITPSISSVSELTENNGFGDYKRVYMSMTYKTSDYSTNADGEAIINQAELKSGYYIDLKDILTKEKAEKDSVLKNDSIDTIDSFDNVWAYRGYITAAVQGYYRTDNSTGIYPEINLVYSPEDIMENAIKFHIYYNMHKNRGTSKYGPYTFVTSYSLQSLAHEIPGTDDITMYFEVDGADAKTITVSRKNLIPPTE